MSSVPAQALDLRERRRVAGPPSSRSAAARTLSRCPRRERRFESTQNQRSHQQEDQEECGNKPKIKNDAVTGAKVKADSLTGGDIPESSLGKVPSATARTNATRSTARRPAISLQIVIRRKDLPALVNGGNVGASGDGGADDGTGDCATGERVISGGVRIAASGVDQAVSSSRPVKDSASTSSVPEDGFSGGNGWRGVASDSGGVAGNNPTAVQVFAICAS